MIPTRNAIVHAMALLALTAGALPAAVTADAAADATWPRAILRGDYPDPSILRDGSDYYMTHSPFYYTPGFLIWHSKDLMHWEPVARAMTDVVGSAMAPDLVKLGGKYYIYFPAAGKNWVIWSNEIRGPWSKPVRLEVDMIDPGHVVDGQGARWLFLSGGHRIRLADDGLSVSGKREKVYDGWQFPKDWKTEGKGEMFLESPKLFRKGGYFYMVSAEGGTAGPPTSHMCVVARSKSVDGPWENSPYNPLVHTYDAGETWWSKGHGTIIDDVKGNWWIVYHAYENGFHTLGRQTLIEPVEWTPDGWIRAARGTRSVPAMEEAGRQGMDLSDEFDGTAPGLQWTSWRVDDPAGITVRDGKLQLAGKGGGPADARLLLETATDHSYEIMAEVTPAPGGSGGLVLFYNEKAYAGIASDGKNLTIYRDADGAVTKPNPFGPRLFLKIINRGNVCEMLAGGDGETWTTLQTGVDVSGMHHNRFKGFLALRPGLMAAGGGGTEFDHFQYKPLP